VSITRLEIGRYKRLATRSSDVWQGGLVRLPMWVGAADETPYRVRGAFWRSARTGLVWMVPEDEPRTADAGLAVQALLDFAKKYDRELLGRPARLEVTNAAFADELRALLDDRDTTIAVADDLPDVRAALQAFAEHRHEGDVPAALLDMPGVTIDRLRGFAGAAAVFYRRAPWEALDATDVLMIDAPIVPPALSHVIVTGSTPDMRGLMAFETRRAFERFEVTPPTTGRKPSLWFLAFVPIDELPFGDADAWTDHDLPLADPDAYPRPGRPEGYDGLARPDAQYLAGFEAILRAITESTDDDFDSGEWTRTVTTADGDVTLRLSLPRLLEAMADETAGVQPVFDPVKSDFRALRFETERALRSAQLALGDVEPKTEGDAKRLIESVMARRPKAGRERTGPRSAVEQAQDLAYEAMSAQGRRCVQLARRALAISRDCPDAWSALAGRARDLGRAIDLFREAVAAGERALGPDIFEREAGHFWSLIETRPYMRARLGLAECLDASGGADEAIAHYGDLLRLNPDDNQAVRQPYLLCLLDAGRDDDAEVLIDRFKDDERPDWYFSAALVAFRREGDSTDARERLDVALRSNRHVAAFLTGEREIVHLPVAYKPGSVDEAQICADWLIDVWSETPNAVAWLAARDRAPRDRRRHRPAKA
jgi:tetratricopeptide (TPR) repeat protein